MRCEVKLLDAVALLEDVQTDEVLLQRGEVGAVVEILAPDVYEVEFCGLSRNSRGNGSKLALSSC